MNNDRRIRISHLTSIHDALDDRSFQQECRSFAAAGYDEQLVTPYA